ncbi:hypothetical protein [Streptobacillus moniliformis]|uniref:hypothetical protein n=1 Tax=Streptobacillus moniliformis TaxID=34105 RepID=UPI0007E30567|nr:hypothetical protein [Streptobacillus moniliformis]
MLNKRKLIGLITISTTVLGAEYYVKNDNNIELSYGFIENTIAVASAQAQSQQSSNAGNHFSTKVTSEINWGGIFGKNKEVFTFLGVGAGGEKQFKSSGKREFNTKGYIGINLKKKLTEELELILNASYQYKDNNNHEGAIKELIKSRGEWKKEFEEDKEALKKYYHSQGLRFKEEESLFSGIVNYKHKLFKLHSGVIYTAGYLNNGDYRLENFVNIKTSKGKHDIEGEINYKIKKDTYAKGGRLKLDLNTTSRLNKVDIHNRINLYLGTIIPNKKDYKILLENGIKYSASNNLELNTTASAEVVFKQIETNTKATDLKVLYKPELKLNVKYNKDNIDIESNNKLMGRVETKGAKLDKDEYDSSSKKDQTIASVYTGNMIRYKSIRGVGKYSGIVKMKKGTNSADFERVEHLLEVGAGLTYEKKIGRLDIRHSVDGRYIFGYIEKNFSILNLWSDNKAEYRLNNKVTLKGELNLTTSNRLSIINHDSNTDEFLLLADTKGTVEYKLNNKTDLTSTIGAKTISLFSTLKNAQMKNSQSNTTNNGPDLHLSSKYTYKVYNENKVKYQIRDNIGLITRLDVSYADNFTSDKLYESLNKIKRNQVGKKGLEEINKEALNKINKETAKFGNSKSILLISPSVGTELKYLNNKLIINPNLGVDVKAHIKENGNKLEYKTTNIKARLQVEYRW